MQESVLTPSATVCVIGFGQSGRALAAGLAQRGYAVRAWDLQLEDPVNHAAMRARMQNSLVDPAPSMSDAMHGAKLVVIAMDAASATKVSHEVAGLLVAGQELMDLATASAAQIEMLGFAYDPVTQTGSRGELP